MNNRLLIALFIFCIITIQQNALGFQVTVTTLKDVNAAMIQFIELNARQALQSSEARLVLTGEASKWETESFGKLATLPDRVELLPNNTAVARVQLYGENNYVTDLYFILSLKDKWKITAVRRIALTGIPEELYQGLKSKKTLTKEEQYELGNLELMLSTDAALRTWFSKNREKMNKIQNLASKLPKSTSISLRFEDGENTELRKLLEELNLESLSVDKNGNIEILVGGVLDNTVGFIFSPDNKPPAMNPSNYIWVEELESKWFLYRTT